MKLFLRIRAGVALVLFIIIFEFLSLPSISFGSPRIAPFLAEEPLLPGLSLIGVIVSKEASSSVALLKDEKTGKTITLRVGEGISGLTLVQVFENRIILGRGEKNFLVFMGKGSFARAQEITPSQPTEVSAPPQRQELVESTQPAEAGNILEKEFSRAEILKRLEAEWPVIINETRFLPNLVEGRISGFKVTNIPQRTVLSEVGIYENDVIKEVNGVELNSMETLFSLYNQFKDGSRFEVRLERNGKPLRIIYKLK